MQYLEGVKDTHRMLRKKRRKEQVRKQEGRWEHTEKSSMLGVRNIV